MLLLKPFTEDHGRSAVHPPFYFHCAPWFATTILAHMLDSLVRVSRRAGGNHFVSLGRSRSSAAAEVPTRDTEAPPRGYPTAAAQADTLHEKHRARADRDPGCPEDGRSGARQSREARLVSSASPSATSGTFNSLSKVLFTFPSWYFYAIGLESIFSFG